MSNFTEITETTYHHDELARLRGEVERLGALHSDAVRFAEAYKTRAETAEARVRELEAIRKEQANGTPDHTELVKLMYATIFGDGKSMGLIDCIAGYYGTCFEGKLAEIEARAKMKGYKAFYLSKCVEAEAGVRELEAERDPQAMTAAYMIGKADHTELVRELVEALGEAEAIVHDHINVLEEAKWTRHQAEEIILARTMSETIHQAIAKAKASGF
jgi:hypothetical protein